MSRVTFTPSSTCKTKWKPAVTIQKKYMTDSLNTNSGKAERCEVFDLHHQQQKLLLKGVNLTQRYSKKKSCSEKASSELYTISELLFIAPDSRKYVNFGWNCNILQNSLKETFWEFDRFGRSAWMYAKGQVCFTKFWSFMSYCQNTKFGSFSIGISFNRFLHQ